jgi:hypothetical protein
MPWDSDKSTAADPDNPAADEQVTADEWDAHVADQKSRVLYGPVADRPAAGDVPNGTVYLITDLANNGGVLTEVVSGVWELKQIGDDSNRPDIVGDEGDFNSVVTETLSNDHHYAGSYDGSDPETRLTNALSAASVGDIIHLENADYGGTRTISTRLVFKGTNGGNYSGTRINGSWTCDERVAIQGVYVSSSGDLTFNADHSMLFRSTANSTGSNITISASRFKGIGLNGTATITFESGTASGIIDGSTQITVTDNGSNTVGDIA